MPKGASRPTVYEIPGKADLDIQKYIVQNTEIAQGSFRAHRRMYPATQRLEHNRPIANATIMSPNPAKLYIDLSVDLVLKPFAERYPVLAPLINEMAEILKSSDLAKRAQNQLRKHK